MLTELDGFRIDTFKTDSLDTIIRAEPVDETAFMGHRIILTDTSLKGFTKLSGVTANFNHAYSCLRKLVDVYNVLAPAQAWMESEIVFKDEPVAFFPVKNFDTNTFAGGDSLQDILIGMMCNGWGYSDQIAYGNGKGFRKLTLTRDNWHEAELISPVELSHTAPVDNYDHEMFLERFSALAEASVTAWNSMPTEVPTQNVFGSIQVDKVATDYAFGHNRRIKDIIL